MEFRPRSPCAAGCRGCPKLRFGELGEHGALLAKARAEAEATIAREPQVALPEHEALARVLEARTGGPPIYGADAGWATLGRAGDLGDPGQIIGVAGFDGHADDLGTLVRM